MLFHFWLQVNYVPKSFQENSVSSHNSVIVCNSNKIQQCEGKLSFP